MMASIATNFGVTLAPFHQIYGAHDVALLADSFFTSGNRRAEKTLGETDEPPLPTVIQMPNRAQFDALLAQWLNDMAFDSLPDQMKEHDSFQQIVHEGNRVVPLIAASLRRSPSFLFLALEEIFGEDPVPAEAYGNLQATVASWLQCLQR
jgi:hypothetical protein